MALQDYQEDIEEPISLQNKRRLEPTPEEWARYERTRKMAASLADMAAAESERRRKTIMEGAATPQGQQQMAQEREQQQLQQLFQRNPKLQEQFLIEKAKRSLQPAPAGYRMNPDGTMAFVPGGPADPKQAQALHPKEAKPITEFQGKNAMYGSRAMMADAVLNNLEENINLMQLSGKQGVENIPILGGIGGMIGNAMLSKEQQKVDQAQRNFVNALLRQESGATINPNEFTSAQKQYFAQPGDDKETIAQKRANRQIAIKGFKTIAGPAWSGAEAEMKQIQQAQGVTPQQPGLEFNGYQFPSQDALNQYKKAAGL